MLRHLPNSCHSRVVLAGIHRVSLLSLIIIKEDKLKQPSVYILASKKNGTLYIGVTSNLVKRIWQHKNHIVSGFSEQHEVTLLVYFEQFDDMYAAITREKVLKKWNRAWKIRLIEKTNPNWLDLYNEIS